MMSEKNALRLFFGVIFAAIVTAVGLIALERIRTSEFDARAREACFASNERIAKTFEKASFHVGPELNRCDWR